MPFEPGDGSDGAQPLGAVLLAALVGVAGMTTTLRGERRQALALGTIASVIDERPGAVEGCGLTLGVLGFRAVAAVLLP